MKTIIKVNVVLSRLSLLKRQMGKNTMTTFVFPVFFFFAFCICRFLFVFAFWHLAVVFFVSKQPEYLTVDSTDTEKHSSFFSARPGDVFSVHVSPCVSACGRVQECCEFSNQEAACGISFGRWLIKPGATSRWITRLCATLSLGQRWQPLSGCHCRVTKGRGKHQLESTSSPQARVHARICDHLGFWVKKKKGSSSIKKKDYWIIDANCTLAQEIFTCPSHPWRTLTTTQRNSAGVRLCPLRLTSNNYTLHRYFQSPDTAHPRQDDSAWDLVTA